MALVRRRRGLDKKKSKLDDDFGFNNPPYETVEALYWERENSAQTVYPDDGGALDQDSALMDDLNTYGWRVSLANKIIDEEEEARKLIESKTRR